MSELQDRTLAGRTDLNLIAVLLVEHRLLREMMDALGDALVQNLPASALRERAAMLEVALDAHARREEEELFAPLRARSESARYLIGMMELVHEEVRSLFEEIRTEADPTSKLWTILELTAAHFDREEDQVFPLAETLMGAEELAGSPAR